MLQLIVVDNPKTWPLRDLGAHVVEARAYLTLPHYSELRAARVFNLCRSYRYQTTGYYVSLLAMARGHKPVPSITTIQDMKTVSIVRLASDNLEHLIQRSLRPVQSSRFTLSVYFGQNLAKRYDDLSAHLFRLFHAPFLRAEFGRDDEGWRLSSIRPLAASEIPETHQPFVIEAARQYFAQKRHPEHRRSNTVYDLAILYNPAEPFPPSNPRALKRFLAAAKDLKLGAELIERDDMDRLAEFDALFIRETTAVNHYTYRFARRAVAEGLVVIDDPDSITKCANKVYLAELLECHRIPRPKTVIVHRDNRDMIRDFVGLPCVLKQPDSSFSRGVKRIDEEAALLPAVDELLDTSDLIIAQQYLPTPYDWRIAILDNQALFACKYHMARDHWQIVKTSDQGVTSGGKVETVAVQDVPPRVLQTALRATKYIGDGLYGVDLKEVGKEVFVIEINDNPNIDAGYEDRLLGDTLYEHVMRVFLDRIQRRKQPGTKVER